MAHNIGQAVAYYRTRREVPLTGAQLAERMTELGYPYTRATVANLENGRKNSVDVAELLALASCLDVPPAALLFQTHETLNSEALPGWLVYTPDAVRWLVGYPPAVKGKAFYTTPEAMDWTATHFAEADAMQKYGDARERVSELLRLGAPDHEVDQARRIVSERWDSLEDVRRRNK